MPKRLHKNYNSIIIELLRAKSVAFNPVLGRIANSANAGLFMSQLLYWWDKGKKNGWIWKTVREFQSETCLTRGEQDTAIKIWRGLGVLKTKRAGIPATRHFSLDIDLLIGLIASYAPDPSLLKTAKQIEETNRSVRYLKRSITEITQKNTQENRTYKNLEEAKKDLAKKMNF